MKVVSPFRGAILICSILRCANLLDRTAHFFKKKKKKESLKSLFHLKWHLKTYRKMSLSVLLSSRAPLQCLMPRPVTGQSCIMLFLDHWKMLTVFATLQICFMSLHWQTGVLTACLLTFSVYLPSLKNCKFDTQV